MFLTTLEFLRDSHMPMPCATYGPLCWSRSHIFFTTTNLNGSV